MSAISSIFGALKYVPATVARKALEKVNPGFKNYFSSALSYGVDANRALDFLTDRFESEAQRSRKQQLEQGEARNTLRPDEMASKSQMENQALPGKLLKTAASFATGGLLGGLGSTAPVAPPRKEEERELEKPSARAESVMKVNAMHKKKKLLDQLIGEFEEDYGQGSLPPTVSQSAFVNPPMGGPAPAKNIERLISLLEQRKQGRR